MSASPASALVIIVAPSTPIPQGDHPEAYPSSSRRSPLTQGHTGNLLSFETFLHSEGGGLMGARRGGRLVAAAMLLGAALGAWVIAPTQASTTWNTGDVFVGVA